MGNIKNGVKLYGIIRSKNNLAEFGAERTRYVYLVTIGNAPSQILYGREGGTRFAIRIEADAAFLDVIRKGAELAVAYRLNNEENEDDEE